MKIKGPLFEDTSKIEKWIFLLPMGLKNMKAISRARKILTEVLSSIATGGKHPV